MIVEYKLTYPSGTATAALINGFHTAKGDNIAKYAFCFYWSKQCTQNLVWKMRDLRELYSQEAGSGFHEVLFDQFPVGFFPVVLFRRRPMWIVAVPDFWIQRLEKLVRVWILWCFLFCCFPGWLGFVFIGWAFGFCRFYFDCSMSYIGAGMICSHLVNLSLLLGALLSWGIMWPLISGREGDWFPNMPPESSMKSLNGYKVNEYISRFDPWLLTDNMSFGDIIPYSVLLVMCLQVFISIALILGDGLYNFLKVMYLTTKSICARMKKKNRKTCKSQRNFTWATLFLSSNELSLSQINPVLNHQ